MAIVIRSSPEPLSAQSERLDEEGNVYIAQSNASRILLQELRRYCNGHIQGRSFLVAGHRGAGKTTMVAGALTTAIKLSQTGDVALRPLPVLLHGPSLFRALPSDLLAEVQRRAEEAPQGASSGMAPASAPAPAPASAPAPARRPARQRERASAASPEESLDKDSQVELQAQVALKQIILGLHRSTVREYAAAYRRALVPIEGYAPPAEPGGERGELAAQFELELMEDPPAARLRELWAHVDALDSGVLFPGGRLADTQQARRALQSGLQPLRVADQGARELVALNGICNAHQRISGVLSGETKLSQENRRDWSRTTSIDPRFAEAIKPAAALLAGAAVAGGAAAGRAAELPGALALGLLTAVAGSLVFKRSASGTGKRERQVDKKFIPDLSLRTLDRVLPTLLERLRGAGLAPVFVIDELDKVDGLSDRIKAMVHFLKKLFAETVFTCFLTDRGYLESLRLAARAKAYGVAYSYFSHPLLLAYEPGDLDELLHEVLVVPVAPNASQDDIADKEILKWVLRHRSQMHALNLTRELAAIRSDGGNCNLPAGMVRRAPFYRIDATLQVVIEFWMNTADVVGWSAQHPAMRQTLFDALYYISRQWLGDRERVDLRDACLADFRRDLFKRMNIEEVFLRDERAPELANAETTLVSDDDLRLLYGTVRNMAAMLCSGYSPALIQARWPHNPHQRDDRPKAPRPEQAVLEVLMLGPRSLLIADPSEPHLYRFRYWKSGQRRDVADLREPQEIHQGASDLLAFVTQLRKSLAALLRPAGQTAPPDADFKLLADDAHVLPQTPPARQAINAHDALTQAEQGLGSSQELEDHSQLLSEFVQMLRDNLDTIGPALNVGAFLTGVQPAGSLDAGLPIALRRLSDGLRFATMNSAQVRQALQVLQTELETADKRALPPPPVLSKVNGTLSADAAHNLGVARTRGHEFAEKADWAQHVRAAWQRFAERLSREETSPGAARASADEILCAAYGCGPGRLMPLQLSDAALPAWSSLLLEALQPATSAAPTPAPSPPSDVAGGTAMVAGGEEAARVPGDLAPFGVIGPALLRCGFGRFDTPLIDSLCQRLQALAGAAPQDGTALRRTLFDARAMKREPAPLGSAIVVRKNEASATQAWTEVPQRALFVVLTRRQLDAQSASKESLLRMLPPPLRLIVEPDESLGETETRTLSARLSLTPTPIEPTRWATLGQPRGADDLFSFLRPQSS